mmetsp:Transcript_15471/g.58633  ORF Transcript_15471/g.58633 Transcript_15471/m.58633 type:complete len:266 (-) Transcript_15471:36-833(-)
MAPKLGTAMPRAALVEDEAARCAPATGPLKLLTCSGFHSAADRDGAAAGADPSRNSPGWSARSSPSPSESTDAPLQAVAPAAVLRFVKARALPPARASASGCRRRTCSCKCPRCVKVCAQTTHSKSRRPMCTLATCCVRCLRRAKRRPHVSQRCRRAWPWYSVTCSRSACAESASSPQCGHAYLGFTPCTSARCRDRDRFDDSCFPHSWHSTRPPAGLGSSREADAASCIARGAAARPSGAGSCAADRVPSRRAAPPGKRNAGPF